jgi:hypothetical protein
MENQHRKITGYCELTQEEIDLMNEVERLGALIEVACNQVLDHLYKQREASAREWQKGNDALRSRLEFAEPEKWANAAKIGFQTNLMHLTRAVAKPTHF